MDLVSFIKRNRLVYRLSMDRSSPLFISLTKLGTASSVRSHLHMKNAKLTPLHFTFLCLKMSNKPYSQSTPRKKDGISYIYAGLISLLALSKGLNISMSNTTNGCRHILVLLMLFSVF